MTESQREWVETRKMMLAIKPMNLTYPPEDACRFLAFRIVRAVGSEPPRIPHGMTTRAVVVAQAIG